MQKAHHWYDFNALRPPGILKLVRKPGSAGNTPLPSPPAIAGNAPRGDGHPVLVLPGMLAGDLTTRPLRRYLKRRGYTPVCREQGLNLGPREGVIEAMLERLKTIYLKHERPVSLIGWSLGEAVCAQLAKAHPEIVRSVITMGTPFTGQSHQCLARVSVRYRPTARPRRPARAAAHRRRRCRPPRFSAVPTVSSPGAAAWSTPPNTAKASGSQASHLGMGMNPLTLYAIADRLAQPGTTGNRSTAAACLPACIPTLPPLNAAAANRCSGGAVNPVWMQPAQPAIFRAACVPAPPVAVAG